MKELIEDLRVNADAHPLDVRLSVMIDAADALESQAREIYRLNAVGLANEKLTQRINELKAQAGGVVMPEHKAEPNPTWAAAPHVGRPLNAEEITEARAYNSALNEVARLNQPASGSDDPIRYWFIGDAGQEAGSRHCKKSLHDGSLALFESEYDAKRASRKHPGTEVYLVEYYRRPQALSANHSEQVRVVPVELLKNWVTGLQCGIISQRRVIEDLRELLEVKP